MKHIAFISFFSMAICLGLMTIPQQSFAVGFQWSDVWFIDEQNRLRELDPTTGWWHPRESDALAVEGSYYNNGHFEATFYINTSNEIFQWRSGWEKQYGAYAVDVGSGGGKTYVVTKSGYVYKQQPWGMFDWIPQIPYLDADHAKAWRVDVDENGVPWVVVQGNKLYTQVNGLWVEVNTQADPNEPRSKIYPVDVGANAGKVYVAAHNSIGGLGIYRYENGIFVHENNGFIRVDIDRDGNIWGIGTSFDLWKKVPGATGFQRISYPNSAFDVGA